MTLNGIVALLFLFSFVVELVQFLITNETSPVLGPMTGFLAIMLSIMVLISM